MEITIQHKIKAEEIAAAIGELKPESAEIFIDDLLCLLPETRGGKAAWQRAIKTVIQNTNIQERSEAESK
jgi:hypothetical protein